MILAIHSVITFMPFLLLLLCALIHYFVATNFKKERKKQSDSKYKLPRNNFPLLHLDET